MNNTDIEQEIQAKDLTAPRGPMGIPCLRAAPLLAAGAWRHFA